MLSRPSFEQDRACNRCGLILGASWVPGRERICIECRRQRGREHYAANRQYYVSKAQTRNRETSNLTRQWVENFLRENPCCDCGNADIRVLEFDHRNPSSKRAEVSVLVANGYSLETVKAEVAKCDVRCANCHSIRKRAQFGWSRGGSAEH